MYLCRNNELKSTYLWEESSKHLWLVHWRKSPVHLKQCVPCNLCTCVFWRLCIIHRRPYFEAKCYINSDAIDYQSMKCHANLVDSVWIVRLRICKVRTPANFIAYTKQCMHWEQSSSSDRWQNGLLGLKVDSTNASRSRRRISGDSICCMTSRHLAGWDSTRTQCNQPRRVCRQDLCCSTLLFYHL